MKKIHSFLFIFIAFSIVHLYVSLYRTASYYNGQLLHIKSQTVFEVNEDSLTFGNVTGMKYILMWTNDDTYPFVYLQHGIDAFMRANCAYTNCFISKERNLLGDYTLYDAVLFHAKEYTFQRKQWLILSIIFYLGSIFGYTVIDMPEKRAPHQKYVFTSLESAHYYPICDNKFEDYFNWTWTYRLDSDIIWGYIEVRDLSGKVVGPAKHIAWNAHYEPVSEAKKVSLASKSKAVVWFVSNCRTLSLRERFVPVLETKLAVHNLTLDIVGKCGSMTCPRWNQTKEYCDDLVREKYYFYLAFENSFAEDYVTEKVLHGLEHDTVPIVFGGADYSRFLPPGSYVDGRKLGPTKLADVIHTAIQNPAVYHEYFRWQSRYRVSHQGTLPDTNPLCQFCAALNDCRRIEQPTSWRNFKEWWNPKAVSC